MNNTFVDLLNKISHGKEMSPRGLRVRQIYNSQIEIDSHFPFVHFEDRPFNWKYFAAELAWYLKAETDPTFISKHSNFWKQLTNAKDSPFKEGTINSNYGALMFNEQLGWAFKSLVNDKNTRQAICMLNRPIFQFDGNKDFVCTMYVNFWIDEDRLNMKVQMRSNDVFYGLTYDVPWFAFIQHQMLINLKQVYPELILGKYYHASDNFHMYERHFELAEKILINHNVSLENPFKMIDPSLFVVINTSGPVRLTTQAQNFIDRIYNLEEQNVHLACFEELNKNGVVRINI